MVRLTGKTLRSLPHGNLSPGLVTGILYMVLGEIVRLGLFLSIVCFASDDAVVMR